MPAKIRKINMPILFYLLIIVAINVFQTCAHAIEKKSTPIEKAVKDNTHVKRTIEDSPQRGPPIVDSRTVSSVNDNRRNRNQNSHSHQGNPNDGPINIRRQVVVGPSSQLNPGINNFQSAGSDFGRPILPQTLQPSQLTQQQISPPPPWVYGPFGNIILPYQSAVMQQNGNGLPLNIQPTNMDPANTINTANSNIWPFVGGSPYPLLNPYYSQFQWGQPYNNVPSPELMASGPMPTNVNSYPPGLITYYDPRTGLNAPHPAGPQNVNNLRPLSPQVQVSNSQRQQMPAVPSLPQNTLAGPQNRQPQQPQPALRTGGNSDLNTINTNNNVAFVPGYTSFHPFPFYYQFTPMTGNPNQVMRPQGYGPTNGRPMVLTDNPRFPPNRLGVRPLFPQYDTPNLNQPSNSVNNLSPNTAQQNQPNQPVLPSTQNRPLKSNEPSVKNGAQISMYPNTGIGNGWAGVPVRDVLPNYNSPLYRAMLNNPAIYEGGIPYNPNIAQAFANGNAGAQPIGRNGQNRANGPVLSVPTSPLQQQMLQTHQQLNSLTNVGGVPPRTNPNAFNSIMTALNRGQTLTPQQRAQLQQMNNPYYSSAAYGQPAWNNVSPMMAGNNNINNNPYMMMNPQSNAYPANGFGGVWRGGVPTYNQELTSMYGFNKAFSAKIGHTTNNFIHNLCIPFILSILVSFSISCL